MDEEGQSMGSRVMWLVIVYNCMYNPLPCQPLVRPTSVGILPQDILSHRRIDKSDVERYVLHRSAKFYIIV